MKEVVTIQDVIDLLNKLIYWDQSTAQRLLTHREPCNPFIALHPTIQVGKDEPGNTVIGIMGILNGLFGVRDDGRGPICFEMDDGQITRAMLTPRDEELTM
jgi:hypothetical protein